MSMVAHSPEARVTFIFAVFIGYLISEEYELLSVENESRRERPIASLSPKNVTAL